MSDSDSNPPSETSKNSKTALKSDVPQQDPDKTNQNDRSNIVQQEIQKYITTKKEIYNDLIKILEDSENNEDDFQNFINNINEQQNEENYEEFNHFLQLIISIANNHFREKSFFQKISHIIQYFQVKIKQTFSNLEIYNLFKSNKLILLFLFENQIINIDHIITQEILQTVEKNGNFYSHFFYPEIKKFLKEDQIQDIEDELLSKDPKIFDSFNSKRYLGENDSYICSLIREDSLEEFITYTKSSNIPLTSKINTSIFETNSFLIENNASLIEYSAFFGSIQIFQYLKNNQVKLNPSLWLYVIHSKNAELAHLLETSMIESPDNSFVLCFIESIKCHHNDLADYIDNNLIIKKKKEEEEKEDIFACYLKYHNYMYFPSDFKRGYEFYYLCSNHYDKLVDLFMKKNGDYIKQKVNNNKISLQEAANENEIEVLFYLLQKKTSIDKCCFEGNKNLSKIVIPSSITSIETSSFKGCSLLKHVSLPSTLTSIGDFAFSDCNSLIRMEIPSSLKLIGNDTPSSVLLIERNAFENCSSLKEIEISNFVCFQGENIFNGCSSLTSIVIPSYASTIKGNIFGECKSLKRVIIPSSVTQISWKAFGGCHSLSQIKIPSSVNIIGDYAFNECKELKEITIPPSVTRFGKYIFCDCSSLSVVNFPPKMIMIPVYFFAKCTSLKSMTIPSSVIEICKGAFSECSSLTEIIIPSSITKIGDNAFEKCSSLVSVNVPSSVDEIGLNSFFKCTSLEKISIPTSLKKIGSGAFQECSSLKEIKIPYKIKQIEERTFSECTSLVSIAIPLNVRYINKHAFYKCVSLNEILILPETQVHPEAFAGCPDQNESKKKSKHCNIY